MNQFKSNKIFLDSETIAEQLRSTRQEKKLKIEDISRKLNISKKYLEALEKGKFNELPTGVYGKNFLREYSTFLGLNYSEIEKIFNKEIDVEKKAHHKELFSRQVAKIRYFLAAPKIIKNLIIAVVIITCFSYLGVAMKKIVAPPNLIVENPYEKIITSDKSIDIIGITEAETQVSINGDSVFSDINGRFTEKINLKTGVNIITITAQKKYGQKNTIERQILVKDS